MIQLQKLEAAISHIENKNVKEIEMNGKRVSKELEIFDAAGEKTRNIKLGAIPPTSMEWERAEHD